VLIDDAQEWVAIGLTGTEAPRRYIVKRVLLYNTETRVLEEIEINQIIPPSGADVGWGFQIAIMPKASTAPLEARWASRESEARSRPEAARCSGSCWVSGDAAGDARSGM